MNILVSQVVAWFKSRNITAHVIAGVIGTLATLYATDQQFKVFVTNLLVNYPQILAAIGAGAAWWINYRPAHSATGIIQEVPAAKATIAQAASTEASIPKEPV